LADFPDPLPVKKQDARKLPSKDVGGINTFMKRLTGGLTEKGSKTKDPRIKRDPKQILSEKKSKKDIIDRLNPKDLDIVDSKEDKILDKDQKRDKVEERDRRDPPPREVPRDEIGTINQEIEPIRTPPPPPTYVRVGPPQNSNSNNNTNTNNNSRIGTLPTTSRSRTGISNSPIGPRNTNLGRRGR
jgi:hypothetical protein